MPKRQRRDGGHITVAPSFCSHNYSVDLVKRNFFLTSHQGG